MFFVLVIQQLWAQKDATGKCVRVAVEVLVAVLTVVVVVVVEVAVAPNACRAPTPPPV